MALRLIGSVLCSALAYCSDGGVHCAQPEPPVTIASLNAELPGHIPDQARVLGVHREAGMDDLIQVKLEMNAAALPSLLASSPLAHRPLDSWDSRESFGPDHAFWDPGSVPSLRSAATTYAGARGFKIGIDERKKGRVVVYLVDHGT